MRQVVLDTETTGLEWSKGDRIIEIGCVTLQDRMRTGSTFHHYLDPERKIAEEARKVHGISNEDLLGKPKFAQIGQEFLDYVAGAQVIIHNAPFDVGFLNSELARCNLPMLEDVCDQVIDSLVLARELHLGKRNSLDALCARYGISNVHRTVHGALLDAQILAEVYLAMTRGQESLDIGFVEREAPEVVEVGDEDVLSLRKVKVLYASESEKAEHERFLAQMGEACLWR